MDDDGKIRTEDINAAEAALRSGRCTHLVARGAPWGSVERTRLARAIAPKGGGGGGADHLVELNLRGTDLRRADLRKADLRGTDLKGADLHYAKLGSVDFRGAAYNKSTKFPEGFDPDKEEMMLVE